MFRSLRNRIGQEMFWFSQKHLAKACFIHINKCGGTSIEAALGIPKVHDTAQARRARVGDAAWRRMFTFSVVRHPFPKVVSHYNYRVKQNYTGLGERPLTLNEWVHESYGRKNPDYFDIPLMFAPCLDWLTDTDGTIMVDEVVKLEDLSAEWPRLAERIGVRADLPHSNRTRGTDLAAASDQLDGKSQAILMSHFEKDFAAFDYRA